MSLPRPCKPISGPTCSSWLVTLTLLPSDRRESPSPSHKLHRSLGLPQAVVDLTLCNSKPVSGKCQSLEVPGLSGPALWEPSHHGHGDPHSGSSCREGRRPWVCPLPFPHPRAFNRSPWCMCPPPPEAQEGPWHLRPLLPLDHQPEGGSSCHAAWGVPAAWALLSTHTV